MPAAVTGVASCFQVSEEAAQRAAVQISLALQECQAAAIICRCARRWLARRPAMRRRLAVVTCTRAIVLTQRRMRCALDPKPSIHQLRIQSHWKAIPLNSHAPLALNPGSKFFLYIYI